MSTVQYGGATRYVCGRATYPDLPELGTIVGPKDTTNEPLVVVGHEDGKALFAYAGMPDLQAAQLRLDEGGEPRSLTEQRLSTYLRNQGGGR